MLKPKLAVHKIIPQTGEFSIEEAAGKILLFFEFPNTHNLLLRTFMEIKHQRHWQMASYNIAALY